MTWTPKKYFDRRAIRISTLQATTPDLGEEHADGTRAGRKNGFGEAQREPYLAVLKA